MTTAAIHPNVIAGKAPTLSPIAPASPSDLDQQHELGQFLTPNPVAEFMASLFEIPRKEVRMLGAGAGAGQSTPDFVACVAAAGELISAHEHDFSQ